MTTPTVKSGHHSSTILVSPTTSPDANSSLGNYFRGIRKFSNMLSLAHQEERQINSCSDSSPQSSSLSGDFGSGSETDESALIAANPVPRVPRKTTKGRKEVSTPPSDNIKRSISTERAPKRPRKQHEITKVIPGRPRNSSFKVVDIHDNDSLEDVINRLPNLQVLSIFLITSIGID